MQPGASWQTQQQAESSLSRRGHAALPLAAGNLLIALDYIT